MIIYSALGRVVILLCLNLLLMGVTPAKAEIHPNAGTYGFQFLNISSDPVSMALGGRGIHSSMDHAAFMRQPAVGSVNSHRSLGASHSPWLDDTTFNNLYYSFSDRLYHFGVALRNLDYGELESRDETGALIGYYHPSDVSLMANYAYRLGPSTYFGINGGVMYQKLSTASSYGVHADVGVTILPPITNSLLSLSVRNIGDSSQMNEVQTRLPISFETDLSKQWQIPQGSLSVELSAIKAVDANLKGVVSTQLVVLERIALRGAYKIGYDAESISAGIGIKVGKLDVNYGWADFDSELDSVHSFGLSWNF